MFENCLKCRQFGVVRRRHITLACLCMVVERRSRAIKVIKSKISVFKEDSRRAEIVWNAKWSETTPISPKRRRMAQPINQYEVWLCLQRMMPLCTGLSLSLSVQSALCKQTH